jgi:hypothetical protein
MTNPKMYEGKKSKRARKSKRTNGHSQRARSIRARDRKARKWAEVARAASKKSY